MSFIIAFLLAWSFEWSYIYDSFYHLDDFPIAINSPPGGVPDVFYIACKSRGPESGWDIVLMHVDYIFDSLDWISRYTGPGDDIPSDLTVTVNYVALVGEKRYRGKRSSLILLYKRQMRELLWSKEITMNVNNGASIVRMDGNYLYVAGYVEKMPGWRNVYIMKMDQNGNIIWRKAYVGDYSIYDVPRGMLKRGDTLYLAILSMNGADFKRDVVLAAYNIDGEFLFDRTYTGGEGVDNYPINLIWGGNILKLVIGGNIESYYGDYDFYILSLDQNGNPLQELSIDGGVHSDDIMLHLASDFSLDPHLVHFSGITKNANTQNLMYLIGDCYTGRIEFEGYYGWDNSKDIGILVARSANPGSPAYLFGGISHYGTDSAKVFLDEGINYFNRILEYPFGPKSQGDIDITKYILGAQTEDYAIFVTPIYSDGTGYDVFFATAHNLVKIHETRPVRLNVVNRVTFYKGRFYIFPSLQENSPFSIFSLDGRRIYSADLKKGTHAIEVTKRLRSGIFIVKLGEEYHKVLVVK